MATFTIDELIQSTGGTFYQLEGTEVVLGIETDSRKPLTNKCFLALKGESYDGHDFVEMAMKQGAVLAIVDRPVLAPHILVEDTLKAYQQIAAYHRDRFSIPVIGITGSSGKTTTKEFVASILEEKYKVLKTEKNYNNEIGLPYTLLQLDETHEACVLEMGMRGFGQIDQLASIAKPTMGIITNVGSSHIDILGSIEGVAKAKAELIAHIPKDGYIILNGDDPRVRKMADEASCRVITYGLQAENTVQATHLTYKREGIRFNCHCFDEVFECKLSMLGEHNVLNALAGVAVGRLLGMCTSKLSRGVSRCKSIAMRQEIKAFKEIVIVNDAYNANPSSMTESIKAIAQLEGKRMVAILGDMLELGVYSEEEHQAIGKVLLETGYGMLLGYGPYMKEAVEVVNNAGGVAKHFDSHEEMAKYYISHMEVGDVILVKGSRGMTMEKVAQGIEKVVQ